MPEIATGSCLCGDIAFAYDGAIGSAAYCHCTDCRRCTGSAFNISVAFDAADFKITRGVPASFSKQAESGHEVTRYFCANCGSPLYTTSATVPDRVFAKAGVIDDPALIRPTHQSWVRSAVPWACIDNGVPAYDKDRD